jgi:hypothetical protein
MVNENFDDQWLSDFWEDDNEDMLYESEESTGQVLLRVASHHKK